MPKSKDPIVQLGAKILREKAAPVPKKEFGSPALHTIIKHMSDVLKKEEFGVAIAAPQIGELLRIFVISGKVFAEPEAELAADSKHAGKNLGGGAPSRPKRRNEDKDFSRDVSNPPDKVFINPEIIKLSKKKKEMSEGCLSVRGKYGTVMRHEKASVKAYDESGKPFTYNGTDLIAHIFQHEVDHLEGVLFIDKAVKLDDDKKE